jgi:methyltransferase (TIGR00027 family)
MKEDTPSSTAFTVLQGLMYIAGHPRYSYLVNDEIAKTGKQILSASDKGLKLLKQLKSPFFKVLFRLGEKALMPGITLHYALRKSYIEDITRQAIADGKTQVISLGAGFDTLEWRLHTEFPDVNFIEIDHPATSAFKAKALFGENSSPSNLHLLAVDFSKQSLLEALGPFAGFDATRPTHFICEGVLPYLLEKDVVILLNSLNELTGKGTRFVFSSVAPMDSPNNNTGPLLNLYLFFIKESLNWTIESADIPAFLEKNGFKFIESASVETFRDRYLAKDHEGELHRGEYLILSEIP